MCLKKLKYVFKKILIYVYRNFDFHCKEEILIIHFIRTTNKKHIHKLPQMYEYTKILKRLKTFIVINFVLMHNKNAHLYNIYACITSYPHHNYSFPSVPNLPPLPPLLVTLSSSQKAVVG